MRTDTASTGNAARQRRDDHLIEMSVVQGIARGDDRVGIADEGRVDVDP